MELNSEGECFFPSSHPKSRCAGVFSEFSSLMSVTSKSLEELKEDFDEKSVLDMIEGGNLDISFSLCGPIE